MSAPQKPMREAMPLTAAFVDAVRDAFGRDTVDGAIRSGMQGGSDFYASENGYQIGSPLFVSPETSVSLDRMILKPRKPQGPRAKGRA